MLVIITSVPHTGTHFMMGLIGLPTCEDDPKTLNEIISGDREDSYLLRHTYSQGGNLAFIEKWGDQAVIVSPLRHPMVTAQSWKNKNMVISQMVDYFHNMINMTHQPLYLPLDAPCRYKRLQEIRTATGLPCETEWGVVHPGNHYHRTLSDSEISLVRSLMHDPFFVDIYGEDVEQPHIPAPELSVVTPISVGKMVARSTMRISAQQ